MFLRIHKFNVKKAARRAHPRVAVENLCELWSHIEHEVGMLDSDNLVDVSSYAMDFESRESPVLRFVEAEDGRIMLDIELSGNVVVDLDCLPALKDQVKHFISLMSQVAVVA